MIDSSLTITDLSGFDILYFHPLINGKQSAIIGIGGDSTQPDYPMSINMTFDHRVSDGREVATFLNQLRARLISYAASDQPPVEKTTVPHRTVNTSTESVGDKPVCCDTCGIDLGTYHRDFGSDAYMLAYFKEDRSMGSVCHRCYGRWV